MKIVFASNYFNHHQRALCRALDALNPGQFSFIATSEMRQDRKDLGYGGWEIPDYVRTAYTGEKDREVCQKLIDQADVVIAGAAPEALIRRAADAGKLVFLYRERPLKRPGISARQRLHFLKTRMIFGGRRKVYLLCAGAYTAGDYRRNGCFSGKAYRWGYFPEDKQYELDRLLREKNKMAILWAGRFLDWKHPQYALETAKRLRDEGYDFTMALIGAGPMEAQLKQMITQWHLENHVRLLGSMKPEQVRSHMENSGIFLFTSDRQEGWGAVMNESMNSGCALVASHAVGSVPYLLEDGKNGLVYPSGDVDMLCEKVKYLLDHPEAQAELGTRAYETITGLWNAETAARRLTELAGRILAGEKSPDLYEAGPCSRAEILRDDWM